MNHALSNSQEQTINIMAYTLANEGYYFAKQSNQDKYGWMRIGFLTRWIYWIKDIFGLNSGNNPCVDKTINQAKVFFQSLQAQQGSQKFPDTFFDSIKIGGFSHTVKKIAEAAKELFASPVIKSNQDQDTANVEDLVAKLEVPQEKVVAVVEVPKQKTLQELHKEKSLHSCQFSKALKDELAGKGIHLHFGKLPPTHYSFLHIIKEALLQLPPHNYFILSTSTTRTVEAGPVPDLIKWQAEHPNDSIYILNVHYAKNFPKIDNYIYVDKTGKILLAADTEGSALKKGIPEENQKSIRVFQFLGTDQGEAFYPTIIEFDQKTLDKLKELHP